MSESSSLDIAFREWVRQVIVLTGKPVKLRDAQEAFQTDHGPANRRITPQEYADEIKRRGRA